MRALLILALLMCETVWAAERTITLNGRSEVTVTTPNVKLADVAELTSHGAIDSEAMIGLQKILIARSPAPGKELLISGTSIVERLKEQGVNLESISYTFPRQINIKRAFRVLTVAEVEQAIQEAMSESGTNVTIKRIEYTGGVLISPGEIELSARPFRTTTPHRLGFRVKAKGSQQETVDFEVTALVDEWSEVPVASRPLAKGKVLEAEDMVMARLNTNMVPADSITSPAEVLGLEITADFSAGELFRKKKVSLPNNILAGSKVTLVYRTELFEATATGIALENGTIGKPIRVRNDNSKRVVSGLVREPGMVEVGP